jgi:hypothetical protein
MADSTILIRLFTDLKNKIHTLSSKNAMMDVQGTLYMNDIVTACNTMDAYIESHIPKEEHIIPMGVTYEQAYFNLTAIPRRHAGPTPEMRKYAAEEEGKKLNRIDKAIQLGKELDANRDKPYFTIN